MTRHKPIEELVADQREIEAARTVPIPGGVVLTYEEELFRQGSCALRRNLIVARSILRKVRTACAGEAV